MTIEINHFRGELYELEEQLAVDTRVQAKFESCWEGLKRVSICRMLGGKQEQIASLLFTSVEDFEPDAPGQLPTPEEDMDEAIQTLYQIVYSKSEEVGEAIHVRLLFYAVDEGQPAVVLFRATAPSVEEQSEEAEDSADRAVIEADAVAYPGITAMVVALMRTQKVYTEANQKTIEVLTQMLQESNERYNNAAMRESAIALKAMDNGREKVIEGALTKAVEQLIRNAEMHYEVKSREAQFDLEKERAVQKAKNSQAFMEMMGNSVLPSLGMIAAAKLTGGDVSDIAGALGAAGSTGGEVSTGAPPPPGGASAAASDSSPSVGKAHKALISALTRFSDSFSSEQRKTLEEKGYKEHLQKLASVHDVESAVNTLSAVLTDHDFLEVLEGSVTPEQRITLGEVVGISQAL